MNKFSILITAFLFIFKISNAQTEKGAQTMGLNLGFMYNNSNSYTADISNNQVLSVTSKTSLFNIGPDYSYFIADKLAIGASLSYSSSTNNNSNFDSNINNYPLKGSYNTYGGTLYVRKYFLYANKVGFRAGPYVSYFRDSNKNTYTGATSVNDNNSVNNNYEAGVNLALVYYPSKHVGVTATIFNLEYDHYTSSTANQTSNNGDSINFNFVNNGLSLSVFYAFGGK